MAEYSGQDRFPASAETVNDGTVRDAASVNVPIEVALDRTTFLRNVNFRRAAAWDGGNENSFPNYKTWAFSSTTYAPNSTTPADWTIVVPNVRADDTILIDMSTWVVVPATTNAFLRLGITEDFGGSGTEVLSIALARAINLIGSDSRDYTLSIHTKFVASVPGSVRIRLLGKYSGSGPNFLAILYGSLRTVLLRPSGTND
jgi:hypothetical protein